VHRWWKGNGDWFLGAWFWRPVTAIQRHLADFTTTVAPDSKLQNPKKPRISGITTNQRPLIYVVN